MTRTRGAYAAYFQHRGTERPGNRDHPDSRPGAGGQNVNKVASAVHLRFDIPGSSLPPFYKERLMALSDQRISKEGSWRRTIAPWS